MSWYTPDVSLKSIVFLFLGFHLNKMVSECVHSSTPANAFAAAVIPLSDSH